eukprot:503138_1
MSATKNLRGVYDDWLLWIALSNELDDQVSSHTLTKKQARGIANIFHKSIGPAFESMKEKGDIGDSAGTLKGKLDSFQAYDDEIFVHIDDAQLATPEGALLEPGRLGLHLVGELVESISKISKTAPT